MRVNALIYSAGAFYLSLLLFGMIFLTSCDTSSVPSDDQSYNYHWRAQVMENNTITVVKMTLDQRALYRDGDSVWVDMGTHRINDTLDNTMLCRLITCRLASYY